MHRLSLIGFGEAARTFVADGLGAIAAHDINPAKRYGLAAHSALGHVLDGSTAVLSLVTTDQALIAAKQAAPHHMAGALYFDMNSVTPDTKRAAALAVEAAGGRYVDVAVMAPVEPGRRTVPLLISGPHAGDGAGVLAELGFSNVRVLPGDVGRARRPGPGSEAVAGGQGPGASSPFALSRRRRPADGLTRRPGTAGNGTGGRYRRGEWPWPDLTILPSA